MKGRAVLFTGLLAGLLAAPALAQSAGTVEFGLFVRKNWFGESYALQDKAGGGARLGFFLLRGLELEAAGSYTPTFREEIGGRVSVLGLNGRLLYHMPLGDHSAFILGGGVTHNKYGKTADGSETGPGALVGFRFGLGDVLSVRLDGTMDYFSSPNDELSTNPAGGAADNDQHWGFQAGLAWLFGNRGSFRGGADADGDGVPDDRDQCADTPSGTAVNSSGCPRVAAVTGAADSMALRMRADSVRAADSLRMAMQLRADSLRADSLRADSARQVQARLQAFQDSVSAARTADSLRIVALQDSLRASRNRTLSAALRDSLAAARMRDSLRILMVTPNARLVLQGVNFSVNTATLTESSQFILDEVANSLRAYPDIKVEVAGHTDNTGGRALNERLSRQRAEAVKAYLVGKGIAEDRMVTNGYAWDKPVASNRTVAGRAQNRRTELIRTE